MRVEEIALRQEVRQMLNEAGFNKNTMKDLVKDVLQEELKKAIKQAMNEVDMDSYIDSSVDYVVHNKTEAVLKDVIAHRFNKMKVEVTIDGVENLYKTGK